MAYDQGDIVWAWVPQTNGIGGEYKTALIVSTRRANRGKDVTIAVLTGQVAKSRRRPRDYILQRWREAGLNHPKALRPKLFIVLKGRIRRDRIGQLHADDRAGMLACLRDLLGL